MILGFIKRNSIQIILIEVHWLVETVAGMSIEFKGKVCLLNMNS